MYLLVCETGTLSVFVLCFGRRGCCAVGAESQLSLTAVSWETSDEMLRHLLRLSVSVNVHGKDKVTNVSVELVNSHVCSFLI